MTMHDVVGANTPKRCLTLGSFRCCFVKLGVSAHPHKQRPRTASEWELQKAEKQTRAAAVWVVRKTLTLIITLTLTLTLTQTCGPQRWMVEIILKSIIHVMLHQQYIRIRIRVRVRTTIDMC